MISSAFGTVGMPPLQPLVRGDIIMAILSLILDAVSGRSEQLERRMSGRIVKRKKAVGL